MIQTGHDDPDRTELLARSVPTAATSDGAALPPGARIGRYRIVALLGRGGMGEVYRAEQVEPVRRTVALKLLRGRRLEARHRAYFEVERQLLAQMRHPAIAQVFDADTTPDGQPWFAMEFIDGSPLTAYCEAAALPLEERLRLLIGVCEGVQHAHQKGVVHRDLKPGNLLVDEIDGRPVPKIIDFGIATVAAGGAPREREVAGTPDYMSPEQAQGDQALVDTRSDIWSLGVVLFELLTGQRPEAAGETVGGTTATLRLPSHKLDTLPPEQGRRLARAQGTSVPRMRRVLRHELDWVVARAMAHERADRYQSASALADDLRRFLDGRTLSAVPASRRYSAGKFVRRHRAGIAAAAVAVAALLGGLGLSVYGLVEARAQRAIAEERSAQLEAVAAFQQSTLEEVDIEAMGAALSAGLREQFGRAGPEAAAMADELMFHASTADLARSLVSNSILARAEEAIATDFAGQPLLEADLGESVASVRDALGLHAEAARGHARVAELRARELGAAHPLTLEARRAHAESLLAAGDAGAARGIVDDALALAASLPADGPLRLRLEQTDAELLAAEGDRAAARQRLEALHARAVAALGEEAEESTSILNALAILQARMGDPAAGLASMQRLLEIHERISGPEGRKTVDTMHNLATMRAMSGDAEGAIDLQRRVVGLRSRQLGAEHPETLAARGNLASFLIDAGRLEESLQARTALIEAQVRVLGAGHLGTLRSKLNLATNHARLGDYPAALALQAEVLDARTRLLGASHPDTLFIAINRAGTLMQSGRPEEALARVTALLPVAREVLGARHPQLRAALQIRGDALIELGRDAEAVPVVSELLARCRDALGDEHPMTIGIADQLARVLEATGRGSEAQALRDELVAPLLAADPAGLSPPLRRLAEDLRGEGEGGRDG